MNERSRTPLIVAIVLVVVAAVGVLAVVLARGSSDDAASPSTSPSTSPSASVETVEVEGTPLPAFEGAPVDPAVGQPAPTLVGENYAGEPISITPGEDGPTMVVFLAHWCPHCNDEIPVLIEWQESRAIPEDLNVVGVSTAVSDQRPNFPPVQWLADKGWPWPVLADDADLSALEAYGGTGFPFFVVVGADGTVKARGSGELPIEQLDALVDAALA